MSSVVQWVRRLGEWAVLPFDYLEDLMGGDYLGRGLLGLTVFSVLSGVGMLWVMGKTTNQAGMELARERMLASVYELRLFMDSPRRVFSAQGRLMLWNGRYIGYMLPAFVVLLPPLVLFYMHLDTRFGWEPLPADAPVLITVDLAEGADGSSLEIVHGQTEGVEITSPPLYVPDERRVYLRAELQNQDRNTLAFRLGSEVVTKSLWGSSERGFVSPERSAGIAHLWAIGMEPPIPTGTGVRAIAVEHQPRTVHIFGLAMPWWVYWLIISLVAALAMRRPMGVVL